jgi:hypothetical protein
MAADMEPLPMINRAFGGSHIEDLNQWFDQSLPVSAASDCFIR